MLGRPWDLGIQVTSFVDDGNYHQITIKLPYQWKSPLKTDGDLGNRWLATIDLNEQTKFYDGFTKRFFFGMGQNRCRQEFGIP
jgi:hypothetical protein